MRIDYITKLLKLPEFLVKSFWISDKVSVFLLEKKTTVELCPFCGHATSRIHDRRTQRIKDIPLWGEMTVINLIKRRFRCSKCYKVFSERYELIRFYARMTKRFESHLAGQDEPSFKYVSKKNFVSEQVAARNFYRIAAEKIARREIKPTAILGIDENSFKKNHKYNTTINDLSNRKLLELLPDKKQDSLEKYLTNFPHITQVRFIVIDMCRHFFHSIRKYCWWAYIVIDKFHVYTHVLDVIGSVRKKRLNKKLGIRITRKMVLKPYDSLTEIEKNAIDYLMQDNERFKLAYDFKEKFLKFYQLQEYEKAKEEILELIAIAMQSNITKLITVGKMLMRWEPYILNYFTYRITNGFTEGMHTKIKTIKRVSYGFRNQENFRLRVLTRCA